MSRIFINALGINNSAGANPAEVYKNIFINQSTLPSEVSLIGGRKTWVQRVSIELPALPMEFHAFESRNNRLLLQALRQLEPELQSLNRDRLGVIVGTSTSGILETEKAFLRNGNNLGAADFQYYKQEISNPSDFLAAFLGIDAFSCTISTACTSSAKAFIEAYRWIQAGFCDAVIVGGVDTVSSLTVDGFDALDSVSPEKTNPFSLNRNGINIGEGAAIFIVSKDPGPVEFLGFGESSDAYHMSSPDPEGVGAELALRAALKRANILPQDVGYINLHGTGTKKNDLMESRVTAKIFGSETLASTTKPFIGHTLGAAGAQEAALVYLALSRVNAARLLPVQLWDQVVDLELAPLNFVKTGDRLQKSICMSNSFAFGGNNVSLIFGASQ